MKKIEKATREKENSAREKSEGKFQITITKNTYRTYQVKLPPLELWLSLKQGGGVV